MTREEALKILKDCRRRGFDRTTYYVEEYHTARDMAIKALEQEPRIGHWISHREHCEMNNLIPSGLGSYFWCSECDCGIDANEWHMNNYNYCPNCGCRMVEPQESEDEG